MASYEELLNYYMQNVPGGTEGQGLPEFGDRFNRWTADIMADLGVSDWSEIPVAELDNYEYIGPAAPVSVPLEQGLLQAALPGIQQNIAGDIGRQAEVERLSQEATAGYGNLRDILGQAAATFDGVAYLRANPDVAAAYQRDPEGLTPAQYAQRHYEQFGRNEGRAPAYTSEVLANQIRVADQATNAQSAAAQTSAQAQLGALNQSISQMQGNLQGALGQQAAALQENIAALQQNLGQLDTSQREALAAQIQQQQQNLERSIGEQRQALETQVRELQGNSTAAAAARRAALEQQLTELTAAQAPLSEARIKGAEALVTAINLGLEGTRDQLRADAAREGLVGGSTMQDAALARATIGARQGAAQESAAARIANAADTRAIGQLGAGGRYSIADAYATEQQGIGNFGAAGRAGLGSNLATGRQAISDYGATQGRSIADTTAASRAGIGAYGANTAYGNTNAGLSANLALQNQGSTGQYNIAAALAKQQQDAADRNAAARVGYSDQLFPNAINAAQISAGLPGAEAATKTGLLPYGSAGTRDALSLLNWWSTPNNPSGTTATVIQPDQSGNQIANLGAGLVGSAFQVGQANNWWQPNRVTKPVDNTNLDTVVPTGGG